MILVTLVTGFFASVTAITCGSLWLANRMDERDAADEPSPPAPPVEPPPIPPVDNSAYRLDLIQKAASRRLFKHDAEQWCPYCNHRSTPSNICRCEDRDGHFHMTCSTCATPWMMLVKE